ncbi:MAG: hypothetical protein CMM61_16855 [Rhodospirillaceae bacterium]|nr:hypothetical protein [Rhodospirillaceae bacterium]
MLEENRWRAQRYGLDEGLVDFGKGEVVSCATLLDEIVGLIAEDAEALDCTAQIDHLKTIQERGTSAHRQIAAYDAALGGGADAEAALIAVVDGLIAETVTFTK